VSGEHTVPGHVVAGVEVQQRVEMVETVDPPGQEGDESEEETDRNEEPFREEASGEHPVPGHAVTGGEVQERVETIETVVQQGQDVEDSREESNKKEEPDEPQDDFAQSFRDDESGEHTVSGHAVTGGEVREWEDSSTQLSGQI
jgi:hypothetical protein